MGKEALQARAQHDEGINVKNSLGWEKPLVVGNGEAERGRERAGGKDAEVASTTSEGS